MLMVLYPLIFPSQDNAFVVGGVVFVVRHVDVDVDVVGHGTSKTSSRQTQTRTHTYADANRKARRQANTREKSTFSRFQRKSINESLHHPSPTFACAPSTRRNEKMTDTHTPRFRCARIRRSTSSTSTIHQIVAGGFFRGSATSLIVRPVQPTSRFPFGATYLVSSQLPLYSLYAKFINSALMCPSHFKPPGPIRVPGQSSTSFASNIIKTHQSSDQSGFPFVLPTHQKHRFHLALRTRLSHFVSFAFATLCLRTTTATTATARKKQAQQQQQQQHQQQHPLKHHKQQTASSENH